MMNSGKLAIFIIRNICYYNLTRNYKSRAMKEPGKKGHKPLSIYIYIRDLKGRKKKREKEA